MQDRYAGDIGDYLKIALLRTLPKDSRLGVGWWLHPDENHNADGQHIGYLQRSDKWRRIDPELFDALSTMVGDRERNVQALEVAATIPGAIFHGSRLPNDRNKARRHLARQRWFGECLDKLAGCSAIFVDPDNGIDLHPDADLRASAKHITLTEIKTLACKGRTVVIYHHQTRRSGGHLAEIDYIAGELARETKQAVTAVRAKPYSSRVFFVVGSDDRIHRALTEFADQFPEVFSTRPHKQNSRSGFTATILTLYPEMFPGPLGVSLAGRALSEGAWSLDTVQIRDFAQDKHRSVDDTPAGGGAGMVLRVDVLARAVDFARASGPDQRPVIALTPRGKPLTQARVRELAAGPGAILLCGRFEGFDERIFEARAIEEVSVGDIVLSGGEPAAIMLLDACIRLLPGVMGAASSGEEESFEGGLLEYPHYTRPNQWEGRAIPEVLRSGDHAKIAAWRKAKAEDDTRLRRPDLWERHRDVRGQPASGARYEKKDEGQ